MIKNSILSTYNIPDYYYTPGPSEIPSILESEEQYPFESDPLKFISKRYITLRNGVQMPLLGLGTTHSGGYNHESVVFALKKSGYRMIDTARRYGVEEKLGIAIEVCIKLKTFV
uniref:NADP-dependent oxidoreductase domain-containing protein n=1 Tax=Panagrolaimus sp. PS1159 TaxID=55785 RepID=A0AC35GM43_9BILA